MNEENTQTINGSQIREGSIEDRHIKGKLSERKIDINWNEKKVYWSKVLENKIIIFYREYEEHLNFKKDNNKTEIIFTYPYDSKELPCIVKDMNIQMMNITGEPIIDKYNEFVNLRIDDIIKLGTAKYLYKIQLIDSKGMPFVPNNDVEIKVYIPLKDNLLNIQKDFPCTSYDYHQDIKYLLSLINSLAKGVYGDNYKKFLVTPNAMTLEDQFKDKFIGSVPLTRNIECSEIINEVFYSRGCKETLNERLSKSIDKKGMLLDNRKIHYHVNLSTTMNMDYKIIFNYLMSSKINDTIIKSGIDLIDIYIEGKLLSSSQYELIESDIGYISGIKFHKGDFKGDEKIELKFTIYNKEGK